MADMETFYDDLIIINLYVNSNNIKVKLWI
jgi:hypothetical protein